MNKNIFLILSLAFISGCSQLSKNHSEARKIVVQKLRPVLEKILSQESPVEPPERSNYSLVEKLPGKHFDINNTIRSKYSFDSRGRLILTSGDYTFPVMTYCMKSSASSPAGHVYSLSQMDGKRAKIIRELNLLAPAKYFTDEIQMVSWGIQNGLSYEELDEFGQKMIDSVIPHYKEKLQVSFLVKLEKEWDQTSSHSGGILPSFSSSMESLEELGKLGQMIQEMRRFRDRLKDVGYDYAKLSEMIDTAPRSND